MSQLGYIREGDHSQGCVRKHQQTTIIFTVVTCP